MSIKPVPYLFLFIVATLAAFLILVYGTNLVNKPADHDAFVLRQTLSVQARVYIIDVLSELVERPDMTDNDFLAVISGKTIQEVFDGPQRRAGKLSVRVCKDMKRWRACIRNQRHLPLVALALHNDQSLGKQPLLFSYFYCASLIP